MVGGPTNMMALLVMAALALLAEGERTSQTVYLAEQSEGTSIEEAMSVVLLQGTPVLPAAADGSNAARSPKAEELVQMKTKTKHKKAKKAAETVEDPIQTAAMAGAQTIFELGQDGKSTPDELLAAAKEAANAVAQISGTNLSDSDMAMVEEQIAAMTGLEAFKSTTTTLPPVDVGEDDYNVEDALQEAGQLTFIKIISEIDSEVRAASLPGWEVAANSQEVDGDHKQEDVTLVRQGYDDHGNFIDFEHLQLGHSKNLVSENWTILEITTPVVLFTATPTTTTPATTTMPPTTTPEATTEPLAEAWLPPTTTESMTTLPLAEAFLPTTTPLSSGTTTPKGATTAATTAAATTTTTFTTTPFMYYIVQVPCDETPPPCTFPTTTGPCDDELDTTTTTTTTAPSCTKWELVYGKPPPGVPYWPVAVPAGVPPPLPGSFQPNPPMGPPTIEYNTSAVELQASIPGVVPATEVLPFAEAKLKQEMDQLREEVEKPRVASPPVQQMKLPPPKPTAPAMPEDAAHAWTAAGREAKAELADSALQPVARGTAYYEVNIDGWTIRKPAVAGSEAELRGVRLHHY